MANIIENNLVITGDGAKELCTKLHEEGIEYFIPYHKNMSDNWLENGMTIKDANFIDVADDRTEYYEFYS